MNKTEKRKVANKYAVLFKKGIQSKKIIYELQIEYGIKSKQTVYSYVKQYRPDLIKSYNLPLKIIK